jgi:hypothetical protein
MSDGPKRDAQGRVIAGTGSLNPGGRQPKMVTKAKRELRKGSVEAAVYLRKVIADESEMTKNRVAAAKCVIDATVPKPKQVIGVQNEGSDLLKHISAEMLERWAREDPGGSSNSGSA